MTAMILRRLAMAVPTLLGVSIIVFALMTILPGDPLASLLSQDATQADRDALAKSLGLDKPIYVRYVNWLGGVFEGDFGYSPYRRRDVGGLLTSAFSNTLQLATASIAIGVTSGLCLGVLGAVFRERLVGRVVSSVAMVGISIPSYWVAILLIILFSATLRWLPAGGMHGEGGGSVDFLKHLLMPAFASSLVTTGVTARMARASLLETYGQDFVATLRAKGLSGFQVLRHVAKNALSPVLTVAGLQVGFLLGGSVLVETIFSWPGLGRLIFQSISTRDFQTMQAGILLIATTFVLVNLIVDLIQISVDPRLRKA
ncbi:MAG TPA: ABC transporter permease [Dehalococcoidia bacterium]|nr:ABC transporter permease [Dehalococcoidia bacterium]